MHVCQSHGITAKEYRALFGLNASTALAAPAFIAAKRALAERTVGPYWGTSRELLSLTTEQRRAYARNRVLRLEARRDPRNRAVWTDSMRQAREVKNAMLQRDSSYRAQVRARISAGRGGRVIQPCTICGASVNTMPHIVRLGRRVTCGPACLHELRSRMSVEVHKRGDVQARVRMAGRRGWPSSAQLLAAYPALDRLSEKDRELVRRFYGLPQTLDAQMLVPETLRELSTSMGLSKYRVRTRLVKALQAMGSFVI